MNKLPKGYSQDDNDVVYYGDTNWFAGSDYRATDLTKKCTCGAWKTYGKDCGDECHSVDWCELYENRKTN